MQVRIALSLLLLGSTVSAQKPWETPLDIAVPVPVELPTIAPQNPFATPVSTPPAAKSMPLREKHAGTFAAQVAAYVDTTGACKRVVLVRPPWGGLGADLQAAFAETTFTPGRSFGGPVATWLPAFVDLKGRIDEGRVITVNVTLPDPAAPPDADVLAAPVPEKRDLELPAVPVEKLDQLPAAKRFKVRIDGRTWRENVRFLVQVGASGRVEKVVFLSCPQGLRGWLLASLSGWVFQPAQSVEGPIVAWAEVNAGIEIVADDLSGDGLRVSRETVYPRAGAQSAGGPPPGA
ncbi:MAG: hypothetical protein MUF10_03970 [Thermoanaerobaculaceae bacterium]|jgi:hypothetical protein|nr:hypothetical protein [Thermoanaerobaculaceae bacterium]